MDVFYSLLHKFFRALKRVLPALPIVVNGPYMINDKPVTYKGHDPNAQTFVTIIHLTT